LNSNGLSLTFIIRTFAMETILSIFKIGTSFASACTHYILILKVNELKKDINTMKDYSLELALGFIQKASLCKNPANIPFLLHSAYNNFSQSVFYYRESTDKLFNQFTEKFFSKLKRAKVLSLEPNWNDYNEDFNEIRKECKKLELSYMGKSICEYYLNEHSSCIQSIDNAIGIYYPLFLKICQRYIDEGYLNDAYAMQYLKPIKEYDDFCESEIAIFCGVYFELYTLWNEKGCEYFNAILEIAHDNDIGNDFVNELPNRKDMINLLAMAAVKLHSNDVDGKIIHHLINTIGVRREALIPLLNNAKSHNLMSLFK